MTVQELIQELESMNPEAEVRLAFQPSWPFEHRLGEVAEVEPGEGYEVILDGSGEWDEPGTWVVLDPDGELAMGGFSCVEDAETWLHDRNERNGETGPVVYIGEGTQMGYLPSSARKALGWS